MTKETMEPLVFLFEIVKFYKGLGCKGIYNASLLKALFLAKLRHWKYNGFWVIPFQDAMCLLDILDQMHNVDSHLLRANIMHRFELWLAD